MYHFSQSLGFLTGKLSRLSAQMLDRRFKGTNISISIEQWRVLAMLSQYDGSTITNIANGLFLSLAPVSRQVKALEALRMVSTKPGATDRKQKCVYLTPAGREQALHCCEKGAEVIDAMMKNLSPTQGQELLNLLELCIMSAEADSVAMLE